MATFRINKSDNFTVMSNYHFKDITLSLKAKGILSLMLSLPEDWDYSINGLSAINPDGPKAIRSALKELENKKYLKRTRIQDQNGKFDYIYDIYEAPYDLTVDNTDLPYTQNGITEPYTQNGITVPYDQKGHALEGHTQKGTQLNTKELNTKESNTNIYNIDAQSEDSTAPNTKNPPKAYKRASEKALEEEFMQEVWPLYPRKQGKKASLKHYVAARKRGLTKDEIIEKIQLYNMYIKDTGTTIQYIKHGSTFFNNLDDEYEITNMVSPKFDKAPRYEDASESDKTLINMLGGLRIS